MNEPIIKILSKFANSFDLKDWHALENTLTDEVECDYQDLRGSSEIYSKAEFARIRKESLNDLKTQHLFSNLEITVNQDHATCQLSAVIYRENDVGKKFNSHVIYHFDLMQLQQHE